MIRIRLELGTQHIPNWYEPYKIYTERAEGLRSMVFIIEPDDESKEEVEIYLPDSMIRQLAGRMPSVRRNAKQVKEYILDVHK